MTSFAGEEMLRQMDRLFSFIRKQIQLLRQWWSY